MNSKSSDLNSRRYGGCTLTGALSVTTQITDAVTVIHGPAGCSHHNTSLLHAVGLEQGDFTLPRIVSSNMSEQDIIFGGEGTLERAIDAAMDYDPGAICVLTSCVSETIGDDAAAVCSRDRGVRVVHIPTGGFLGGTFDSGLVRALRVLGASATPLSATGGTATVIGEKNLEYEVDEHYSEVSRILADMDIDIQLRFIRGIRTADLARVGGGAVNILREPALSPVGEDLHRRFQTPAVSGFPVGRAGTRSFIREVARCCGCDPTDTLREEEARFDEVTTEFDDLRGIAVWPEGGAQMEDNPASAALLETLAQELSLRITPGGVPVPCPVPAPVGPAGLRRLLHRWRRSVHA